jgi:hypothetical protein
LHKIDDERCYNQEGDKLEEVILTEKIDDCSPEITDSNRQQTNDVMWKWDRDRKPDTILKFHLLVMPWLYL